MDKKHFLNFLTSFLLFITIAVPSLYGMETSLIDDYLYPQDINQKRISMDFKSAQLVDVLKVFSQQSGLNFIASDEIGGRTINLYLENVSVEEALERILTANSLTYEIKPGSNIFVVKKLDQPAKLLVTRVYALKFATVPSSKLNSTIESSGEESGSSGGAQSGTEGSGGGIVEAVKKLLTEDGNVIEDPRTNSLIISDVASQFPAIEQTIARLDVRVPQILIELEMLDVSKSTADLLGPKWGNSPITFRGAEKDDAFPFFSQDSSLVEKGASFIDERYRVSTLSFRGLAFTMQLLRSQSDTRNLARPRILTLNNETAEIDITADEVIGIIQNTATTVGTTNSTTAERTNTGVTLKVTPQANIETGEITMALEPKVIQARASQGLAASSNFKDPEERSTKSVLRVRDGDTVILGGLLRTDVEDIRTKVPILSKVPILGIGFRHKDKTEKQRELIIFLTPHIVEENLAYKTSNFERTSLVREQDIPKSKRQMEIDKNLNLFEKKKF